MKIVVTIKNVYGQERIYPYCDKAKLFTALTNSVTLSKKNIEDIKSLGYTIEVQGILLWLT